MFILRPAAAVTIVLLSLTFLSNASPHVGEEEYCFYSKTKHPIIKSRTKTLSAYIGNQRFKIRIRTPRKCNCSCPTINNNNNASTTKCSESRISPRLFRLIASARRPCPPPPPPPQNCTRLRLSPSQGKKVIPSSTSFSSSQISTVKAIYNLCVCIFVLALIMFVILCIICLWPLIFMLFPNLRN